MLEFFTTRQMADLLGTSTWRVRRLFEDRTLPEPGRFAGKRAIPEDRIPEIRSALERRGWLPSAEPAAPDHAQAGGRGDAHAA
jgi:hypothetical protein